jgi:hypothetical protein
MGEDGSLGLGYSTDDPDLNAFVND